MSIAGPLSDTVVHVTVDEIDPHTRDRFADELAEGLRRYEESPHPSPGRCPNDLVIDKAGHHYFTSSYRDFVNHKHQVSG